MDYIRVTNDNLEEEQEISFLDEQTGALTEYSEPMTGRLIYAGSALYRPGKRTLLERVIYAFGLLKPSGKWNFRSASREGRPSCCHWALWMSAEKRKDSWLTNGR